MKTCGAAEPVRSRPGVTGATPSRPRDARQPDNPGAASAAARRRPPKALPRIPRAGSLCEAASEQAGGGRGCCGPGAQRKVLAGPCERAPRCAQRPCLGPNAVCRASRLPGRARAAATPPSARHHVFGQVRLLRPRLLVHGAGVSPGGADPAPGPAPRHVPGARLLHLPRGLRALGVGELAGLPLYHQLAAQPPL